MDAPPSNAGESLDRVAKVIRSKNAGPFEITFDIMFDAPAAYERVKRSGVIEAGRIATAYRIPLRDVLGPVDVQREAMTAAARWTVAV